MDEHRCKRYSECKSQVSVRKKIIKECRDLKTTERCWCFDSGDSQTGHWIDGAQAKALVYFGIFSNATFVGCWAAFEAGDQSLHWLYLSSEVGFMLLFLAELYFRLHGSWDTMLLDKWCLYDLLMIVICFTDSIILSSITADSYHLLFLRLRPALQILRLGRLVHELRMIIKGILSAMYAVLWSMLLLFLVIYACAVLCSFVITSSDFSEDKMVVDLFANLEDSMLSLFTFATLEDFPSVVRHFMHERESGTLMAIAIVAFVLFTNLALLNLVTAVMVDSIIDILPKKRIERLAHERAATVKRLKSLFSMMDKDDNKKLTLKEFQDGVRSMEEVKHELTRLQMATFEVKELFMLIDFNDNGKISMDEFIEGLLRIAPGPASKKELVGVQYDLHRMWKMLGANQEILQAQIKEAHVDLDKSVMEQIEASIAEEVKASMKEQIQASTDQLRDFIDRALLDLLNALRREMQVPAVVSAASTTGCLTQGTAPQAPLGELAEPGSSSAAIAEVPVSSDSTPPASPSPVPSTELATAEFGAHPSSNAAQDMANRPSSVPAPLSPVGFPVQTAQVPAIVGLAGRRGLRPLPRAAIGGDRESQPNGFPSGLFNVRSEATDRRVPSVGLLTPEAIQSRATSADDVVGCAQTRSVAAATPWLPSPIDRPVQDGPSPAASLGRGGHRPQGGYVRLSESAKVWIKGPLSSPAGRSYSIADLLQDEVSVDPLAVPPRDAGYPDLNVPGDRFDGRG